jgi:hypothetical protein
MQRIDARNLTPFYAARPWLARLFAAATLLLLPLIFVMWVVWVERGKFATTASEAFALAFLPHDHS